MDDLASTGGDMDALRADGGTLGVEAAVALEEEVIVRCARVQ